MLKRYTIIVAIIISISLICSFFLLNHPNPASQLNILLITIDALRPDHLSCYGYKRNTSPNIDKLAKEGVMFTQAISQGSKTIPSLPSIMTSLYPFEHGIVTEQQSYSSINHPLLAQTLKEKGYYTGAIIAHTLAHVGIGKGFDSLDMAGFIPADLLTKKASDFLKKNQGKTFFLWLHYIDSHAPYRPPFPYNKKYLNDNLYKLNKHIPISDRKNDEFYSYGVIPGQVAENNITDVDYYIAQYDGEISFVDEQIGAILEEIKRLDLDKKTIIVITSDHGEYMGEQGIYFQHGVNLYDTLIKVPLIIRYNEVLPAGKIINQQVAHIDIMPTILDLLGVRTKIKASGISLLPMILRGKKYPSRIILSEMFDDSQNPNIEMKVSYRSFRMDNWKLIYDPVNYKLYNLKNDPDELVNLAGIEKEQFMRLRQKVANYYNRVLPKSVTPGSNLDAVTKEKLMSLGYISGGQQSQQKEISIAKGHLRLIFNFGDKTARIYHNNVEITDSNSMATFFEIEGKNYSSLEAIWQVEKINKEEMVIKCRWPDLPLIQIWQFKVLSDGGFSWKVELDTQKAMKITKWNSRLMLPGKYNKWVTVDESQQFRDEKDREAGVVLKDLSSRCIGVMAAEKDILPGVMFVSNLDSSKDIPVIKYSDAYKNKVRMLCFFGARNADNSIFLPGRYNFFSGHIELMDKEKMDGYINEARQEQKLRKKELQMPLTIKRGGLELFFDHGQGRIYYRGNELTNRFGLYTSLLSHEIWFDSQNAIWKVRKVDDHRIIGQGTWLNLPISQDWELELV